LYFTIRIKQKPVNVKKICGSNDPKKNPDAEFIPKICAKDLIELEI